MGLDFTFNDAKKYFEQKYEDAKDFCENKYEKLTASYENTKEEVIDFLENAPEKIDETMQTIETKGKQTYSAIKDWAETNVTWENTKAALVTAPASVLEGFINVGEGLVDVLFYAAGKTGQLFGADDKWSEDLISYDVSAKMYDAIISVTGVNEDIAYGGLHDVGKFGGELLGYYALSSIPYVGPVLAPLAGGGKGVEESINTQLAETGEVNDVKTFFSGLFGAVEGLGYGKATKAATQGIKMLKDLGKEGIEKLGKEAVKSFFTKNFGTILKQTALTTITDKDTYLDTGSVILNNVYSYIETGEMDWGKLAKETTATVALNFISNIGGTYLGDAMQKMFKNSDLPDHLVSASQIDDAVSTNQVDDIVESVAQIDEVQLEMSLRQKIEMLGYDTSNMSFDDMKREFPDLYDGVLDDASSVIQPVSDVTNDLEIEVSNVSQGLNSQQLYNLEMEGTLRYRIESIGYDASSMSLEDMKREFPDLFDEILDERYRLYQQNPDKYGRDPLPTALSSDGTVYYPPEDGFKLDSNGKPILTEVTLTEGMLMDRYGGEGGRFLGLTDDSGNLASYEQRSLCWTEETNTLYNKYTVNEGKVINTETLTNHVNTLPQEEFDKVLAYMSSEGVTPEYSSDGKLIIRVTAGEIAPAYGLPGGGQQLALPVSIEMLKKWGFIS